MRKDSRQAVAANVRAELARRQLTQRDLATHLHRSPPYVSRRLTGEVPFDIDELFAVAEWLDVDVARLLSLAPAA